MNIKTTALSLAMVALLLCGTLAAYAVESNKPASHDATWLHNHGAASKIKLAECLECHTDRVSCIQCHQEVQPRNHTGAWARKGHGLEARWDRSNCLVCHKEDSCVECHQNTPPASHRGNWNSSGHCTQCHKPVQESTCFTCHKTTPHN